MTPLPWLALLRNELDLEFAGHPRILTLATVDPAGHPRARSVVCRMIDGDGQLVIATDARSAKNIHVAATPLAECVFWLPTRRRQFRIAGRVNLLGPTATGDDRSRRADVWAAMSDPARALFTWPASGAPRTASPGEFARAVSTDSPIPESFELLILAPDEVESLDLNPHPHSRTRWRKSAAWAAESINP